MKTRIHKIIAASGLMSRRRAEQLISEGRIRINGLVVTEPGTRADPRSDVIDVDGVEIGPAENRVYVMLHKPQGYITSMQDPQGRPLVTSLIGPFRERLFPVGRLDYDTEGLLILTNDGSFSNTLQHPRHDIPRTYLVKVKGVPGRSTIDKLRSGVYIDRRRTSRAGIRLLRKTPKYAWLEVTLREGRNRQIKKMFESVGHRVARIIRTRFGPLDLADLPCGSYRHLRKKEIAAIKSLEVLRRQDSGAGENRPAG